MKTSSKGNKPLCTTKKQKFVGSKAFCDMETGEVIPMQMVQVEDRDFNFHKVWLQNLVMSLEGISNQRLKLAFWILEHLDKENKLVMTQRAIAEGSGMSLATVVRTMKALQEGKPAFLQKINSGAYRVNPQVVWKGSYSNRMGVCFSYGETSRKGKETAQKAHEGPQEPQDAQKPTEAPLDGQMALHDVAAALEPVIGPVPPAAKPLERTPEAYAAAGFVVSEWFDENGDYIPDKVYEAQQAQKRAEKARQEASA